MNSPQPDPLQGALTAAFDGIGAKYTQEPSGCWRVRCADRFALTARLEDGWLVLRSSVAHDHIHGQAVQRCAWELLLRNGELSGAAKLVRATDRVLVHAATELPLDADGEASGNGLAAQVCRAIDDLKDATRTHPRGRHSAATRQGAAGEAADLPALCAASGWAFNPRGEGVVAVQLETAHGYAQALLEWDDGLLATVDLHRTERSLPASSRDGVAIMLLQLGGLVRAVRPAAFAEAGRDVLVLQAYLGTGATAGQLDRVLAALSVAAGMCHREAALLCEEEVCNRYLLAGHGCSAAGPVPG
jgi:hypothetical protein